MKKTIDLSKKTVILYLLNNEISSLKLTNQKSNNQGIQNENKKVLHRNEPRH